MRWVRGTAGGLILAVAGWVVWYVVAGPGAVTATEPAAPAAPALPLASEGNTFVLWGHRDGQGVKQCEVTARQFRLSSDGRFRELEGITKAIFYEKGRPVAQATAGRARQDQTSNTLDVAGGLTVRLEPGARIAVGPPEGSEAFRVRQGAVVTTSRARWDGAPRRLALPEELLFTHARSRFRARSATIDFPAGRARLRNVGGVASGALISTPVCDYDLETHAITMKRLEYRLPRLQASVARARLNTQTGDFAGVTVTMKAFVRELEPAQSGGRLLASTALAALVAAGASSAPAEKGPAAKTATREVQFTAGSIRSDEARQITVLEKQARLTHRDTEFTADRIEVQREDGEIKVVIATGSPRANDPRSTITGEKFTIYPKERRVLVEGGFKVVTRPKEEPVAASPQKGNGSPPGTSSPGGERKSVRRQLKGETTITGDRLVYNYRRKDVEAQGNLKVLNRGRTVTAQSLTYTDQTEDLVLNGETVRWEDEKGQHFVARGPIKMNLKEGAETLEASQPVSGRFVINEEEDEEETTPAAPSAGKAPPPAPRAPR
jgi:lipopolysaccharide export system protein LptA